MDAELEVACVGMTVYVDDKPSRRAAVTLLSVFLASDRGDRTKTMYVPSAMDIGL